MTTSDLKMRIHSNPKRVPKNTWDNRQCPTQNLYKALNIVGIFHRILDQKLVLSIQFQSLLLPWASLTAYFKVVFEAVVLKKHLLDSDHYEQEMHEQMFTC
jgi:hypothetical protein